MSTFVIRRLLIAILLLWAVVTLVFFSIRLIPGDPVEVQLAGVHASAATIARVRHELGLDRPLPAQYLAFMLHATRLDFGRSISSGQPVSGEILDRVPATAELAISALAIATIAGLVLGILAATFRRSYAGMAISGLMILGISIPDFWLGTMLALIFGVELGWFPVSGMVDWRSVVLPAVTLAVGITATLTRLLRAVLLDVLGADYIRTARAKGLGQRMILVRHALKNALVPVITVYGLIMASLLGGAVVVENVFSWPGLGYYALHAVSVRDYPAVQGATFVFAAVLIAGNLLVDLSYGFLDPRIRYG
ncbi:MAG: ABC transporter permease [Chloroflexi bacterium]|nr:ABC transporter permease [Chloroflexota bacterium]